MTYYSKIILHMIFMLVYFVFMITGFITVRFLKKRTSKWLIYHRTFMIIGLSTAISGISWIVYVVQSEQGFHFIAPHTYIGLGTFILTLTAVILGYKFTSKKTDKNLKPKLRKYHRLMGGTGLVLLFISITSGFLLSGILYLPF